VSERSSLLETRLVGAPGARVRVARTGSGPPLVLLHGYPDDLQVFGLLAPLLASSLEVIAFDWPGMGWSDAQDGDATPHGMADRLREILDGLGIERAALAGMDMGAVPALLFAARHPERVERLVVMNALLFGDERTSPEIRVMRRLGLNALALRLVPRFVFRRVLETSLPRGTRLTPGLEADLWGGFSRREVRIFVSRLCAGFEEALPRLPDAYGRVSCSTLALWGAGDRHFPPVHGERLRKVVPGCVLEVLPDLGHWMVLSHPDAVAASILRFLA
jgi:pimeloyl-ACP methyl ester carboxylesterase